MSQGEILGDFGELVMETDQIEVTSNLPRPDKNWRYTDQQGHEHYRDDIGWPTLVAVDDESYWCDECGDWHAQMHWECPLCHEEISPGMVDPPPWREFIPGRTAYYLNGEPITPERYREILAARRRPLSES